jgi:glycosyltransferase involved in cell wall biosynthesis
MNNPLVSICIPVYNGAKHLKACIDSAINQNYQNWEIIITDDGSTDESIQIAHEYTANDSRIKLHRNSTNLGMAGNWNHCAELATGEWIKYLFQDDELKPNCLTSMLQEAGEDINLIIAERDYIYDNNVTESVEELYEKGSIRLKDILNQPKATFVDPGKLIKLVTSYMNRNFLGEPTSAMIRKDWFLENKPFDPLFVQLCDYEYWIRTGSVCGIQYIPDSLVKFRVHNNSLSALNRSNSLDISDTVLLLNNILYDEEYDIFRLRAGKLSLFQLNLFYKLRLYELRINLLNQDKTVLSQRIEKIKPLLKDFETKTPIYIKWMFQIILSRRTNAVKINFVTL